MHWEKKWTHWLKISLLKWKRIQSPIAFQFFSLIVTLSEKNAVFKIYWGLDFFFLSASKRCSYNAFCLVSQEMNKSVYSCPTYALDECFYTRCNQNQIVFTLFWPILNKTQFNSENIKYNLIFIDLTWIKVQFCCIFLYFPSHFPVYTFFE